MYDPALVPYNDGPVIGKYSTDRDMGILNIPDGCEPVVFRCRLLSRQARRRYTDQKTLERKYEVAFRLGVLSIENLPRLSGDGTRSWSAGRASKWEELTDEAIDQTGLRDTDLWEIGSVIAARSFLPLGTPLSAPQLDSSLRAWAATSSRFAVQSQDSETPPDEPSD